MMREENRKILKDIKRNFSLKRFNNLKIEAKALFFVKVKELIDLILILEWWQKNFSSKKVLILGGGTNILFSNRFFDGLVIKVEFNKFNYLGKGLVFCQSGASIKKLLDFCFRKKLAGLEWAAGLPGTLGGAIYGNAGCFGKEIKDVVESVLVLKRRRKEITFSLMKKEECSFDYRSSIFRENKKRGSFFLIIGAFLKLRPVKNITPFRKKASFIIQYRRQKHPLNFPTLGSTFKNIPLSNLPFSLRNRFREKIKKEPFLVIPVAVLLEKAGLKGKKIGGAQFSFKHPNFIINHGKATAKNVLDLIALAKEKIWKNFRVKIEEEIEIV